MTQVRNWIFICLVTALAAHAAIILAAPYVLMHGAMKNISRNFSRVNQWTHAPRTTEASRRIVRPSPDIAYSSCVFDLTEGPVRLTAPPGDSYVSLSLFQANTDNFFVLNDRSMGAQGAEIVLVKQGAPHPKGDFRIVESPSAKGIALQRRLAPTAEAFSRAAAARAPSFCGALESSAQ